MASPHVQTLVLTIILRFDGFDDLSGYVAYTVKV